ncbi:MAG TPA: polysaccharide lyase family protein [Opitutales bacterium]|nr:polysaccharide lyase family protein [Opitutales bacterium]
MYYPNPRRLCHRRPGLLRLGLGLFLALGWTTAFANQPGGGSTGANVTLSGTTTPGSTSGTVTLSNGIISASVSISSAQVTSMTFNGVQTVSGNVYFSMDGGSSFEVPHNCVLGLTANTTDMADLSFKQTYVSGNASYIHAEDIDIHYVLRRGATGLYVYAMLNHPASYPALNMGEWRSVWKLPNDSTNFYFEREYVDNFRHHDMLNYYEFTHPVIHATSGNSTRIAEIALAPPNDGTHVASTRAGLYNCKYEFSMEYNVFGAWGHASDTHQKGVWIIPGSFEFFNDGPTKQDLILAESYTLIHLGRNHYDGSSTVVPAGTAWSKLYGPWLLYCNSGASADNLWLDAQAQAQAEQSAWPYSWLANNTLYPLSAGRGTVAGRLAINDSLKPAVNAAGAWVGLATPDGSGNYDWQFDSLNYQYWAKADGTGNFTIPHVRPGTYTLYAFNYGAMGQYSQANVTVAAGQTTMLGNVTWNVAHSGNWIAWEIGVPDRNATEFRHGATDYYVPFAWLDFANQFTNPLNFNVGSSNWAHDWNYVHNFWQVGGTDAATGTMSNWPWNINFSLPSVPGSGNATLTIALAGSNGGHLRVWVNRATTSNPNFDTTSIPAGGGDALIREGVHAKYGVMTFSFPVSNLVAGNNTITLLQINGTPAEANYLGYDYVNLELPGSAPASQPAVGRSFTWVGGAGSNSWDVGTFINWSDSGGNATFNQGDIVTFDDSGANHSAVTLTGALKPNGVTVNSSQDYTFSGNGALTGTTGLTKSGSGTLVIDNTGTNNYSGATTLSGGTLQIRTAVSNSANFTVQSGATLSVIGNLATGTLTINSGGTLTGNAGATVAASVVNSGLVSLPNGGVFQVTGSFTNNGTVRLTGGSQITTSGAFTNNGVLDLITGAQVLPANLVNHGVVLDAGSVKVPGITAAGGTVQLVVQSYAGHDFQLQWSPSMNPANWQNIGAPQAGTGGNLTFTDSGGLTNGIGFYRIQVSP